MLDQIIAFCRRTSVAFRRVALIAISILIVLSTVNALTFPATAMSRTASEEDPTMVPGKSGEPGVYSASAAADVTDTDQPVTGNTEGTDDPAELEVTLTPEPTEPAVVTENAEPTATPDVNEEAAVIVEPTATPEVTLTPEPTETPAAEEVEEESDPSADVETAADWEDMFQDVELTGVWADDLLTLAELQKGYKESTKNFVKDDEGKKYGYTRYGEWYGDPYAEWDSLFVMFNLYYAGITKLDFPYQADCEEWIDALKEAEMFHEVNTYVPNKGDLVFADVDEDGESDHVAIVKAVEKDEAGNPDKLIVIEGNIDNEVKESTYEFYNPLITGFAQLPENPAFAESDTAPQIFSFTGTSNRVEVTVLYEEGAFPEGTTMKLKSVWDRPVINAIQETVSEENKEIVRVQAVDITFYDAEGNEIEPSKPIQVTMKSSAVPEQVTEKPVVVHVDNDMNTSVVEASTPQEEPIGSTDEVTFEAGSFSVYAIVYTVDFHYEVNGKQFDFSLPGGGYISLTKLFDQLAIAYNNDAEASGAADPGTVRIQDIAQVSFSDPTLVWVGQAGWDTTVGGLKEAYGLVSEYSAELSESLIEKINAETVTAGEWGIISLRPFGTEEVLTITFTNGDQFEILVTDALINTDYLSADGTTYHIEVTLDGRENVEGALELSVSEIEPESEYYDDYLYTASEYMFLESPEDISFARFFDIKILNDGEKYEPEYPVQVKITYDESIECSEDEQVSVVHFASSGPEVIQAVTVSEDGKELTYEQSGFSVTATVVAANNIQNGHQYVIYTSSNSNYYALTHYSEGRDSDLVYGVQIDARTSGTFTEQDYGSDIVWTAHTVNIGGATYYTFSYEEGGKTYYLRSYGGLMVGTDSDIDENDYREATRYQWIINDRRLRARYTNDNNRRLRYSNTNSAFRERDNNASSQFYFADVSNYTQDVPVTPTIHFVDESGNPLTVVNGRDWSEDNKTSPAFLMYDIEGYDYVKSTLGGVGGTEIRPLLRRFAGHWQYTTATEQSTTIRWQAVPADQDIYVVYKKATEPVTGGTPKAKESGSTKQPVDPSIHKSSVSNGDGTNTIGLSITADTSPLEVVKLADVIVIFDTSTSMRRKMGTSTTTYYDNNTPASQQGGENTRLYIAANAVNSLAEKLIGDNTEFKDSAGNKLIRMSLISFNRNAQLEQGFTENIADYKRKVNALTTEAGTNWEAALDMANHLDVDPERATFVIFVTDGNPSYRTSRGNTLSLEGYPDVVNDEHLDVNTANSYYFYRVLNYFGALDENDARNFNTATLEAKSIVDHKKNYYAIGVGPASGVSRLQDLTTFAYNGDETKGKDRTKNAEDSDALTRAFNEIAASIVALLGWGDINMTDGITSLANTVEKSHLVNVDGNFEYWKAPAPAGWNDMSKEERAAFLETYVPADSAFVPWNPTTENCNPAVYDETSASVKWDMGHNFVPESGCTYKVTFRVWPSQEAYDILANLKNGTVKYEDLTDAQKAQIIKNGDTYTLKTNDKDPSTTYKAARKTGDGVTTTGDPKTLKFNDVEPMPLVPDKITVKKEWDYDIGDTHKATELDFRLMVGDKYYQNDGTFAKTTENAKVLPVSEAKGWTNSINIAPGIVIFDEKGANAQVLETGHDYRLDEFNVNTHDETTFDASYEFTSQTVRPMVLTVEGSEKYHATLAYLVKIDEDNPAPDGKDQFTIGDATYYVSSTGSEGTVIGTNHRKAELDITKLITDKTGEKTEADLDAETFTYRVTLTVPKDTDCSQMTAYEFVYRADDDPRLAPGAAPFPINGYQPKNGFIEGDEKSGAHYRSYTIKKGNTSIADSFTLNPDGETKNMTMDVTLNRKEVLRFTNLPSGTAYTIQEIYANYRQADPSRDADAVGSDKESNLAEQGYTTTYKTKKTTDETAVGGEGTTITGTITDLDIRYYNQFTNTLGNTADAELKVTKALDGLEWTTSSRYYFKLTAVDGAPLPTGTGSNTGRTQLYITSTTTDHTYTFGKIRFTQPGTYQYKITETDSSWNSIAGQVINGIQYGSEETITITAAEQDGKLTVTDITGSGGHTVKSSVEDSELVVGTTTITNHSLSVPIRKIDRITSKQLEGAVFELRTGSAKLYLDSN